MNNTTPSPTVPPQTEVKPEAPSSPQSTVVAKDPLLQQVSASKQSAEDNDALERIGLEHTKLLGEIHWLKLQRMLAVLSTLGAVIAFMVMNSDAIKRLLLRPSFLQVVIEDEFLRNLGRVELTNTMTSAKVFDGAARDLQGNWNVPAGSYQLKVLLGQEVAYERSLQVLDNKDQVVTIEAEKFNSIRLNVASRRSVLAMGESLPLTVTSSGNGYLWVFELLQGGAAKPLYPLPGTPGGSNLLQANQAFRFPTADGVHLLAGTKPGKERFLMIVTSSQDAALAGKIADRFAPAKAVAEVIPENWGMSIFDYEVH